MSTNRPLGVVRPLVLAAAATFVFGMPVLVMGRTQNSAPTTTKSASAVTGKHAKEGASGEWDQRRGERLQKMTQALNLSSDQVAKVKSILEAKSAQASALRAKYKGQAATAEDRAAMEKAHRALHADTEAKLAQVLTAEQMTKYKQMRSEHMKHKGAWEHSKQT